MACTWFKEGEVKFLHFTEFIKIIPVVFRIKTVGGGVIVVGIVVRFAVDVVFVLVGNLDLGTVRNPSYYRNNLFQISFQLEGNVLRNLRPAMFRMLMGKIFNQLLV